MYNKSKKSLLPVKQRATHEFPRKSEGQLPSSYGSFLKDLKVRIRTVQLKAVLSVNSELILLYYDIGIAIMEKQQNEGWGNKTINRLSIDLYNSFPDMKGFSPRNLLYMKQFAEAYIGHSISQQAVAKLPWGHNVILIDKLDSTEQRLWYAQKTIEHGWSRAVLIHQIESG